MELASYGSGGGIVSEKQQAEVRSRSTRRCRVTVYLVISCFILLIGFSTTYQVYATVTGVAQEVTALTYVSGMDLYPPATIVVMSFIKYMDKAHANGSISGSPYGILLESLFVDECHLESFESQFTMKAEPWTQGYTFSSNLTTFFMFPAPRKWHGGFNVQIDCLLPDLKIDNIYSYALIPEPYEQLIARLIKIDFDYDYETNDPAPMELLVRGPDITGAPFLSDNSINLITMHRQENLLDGELESVKIFSQVSSAALTPSPSGLKPMMAKFSWRSGEIVRINKFRGDSYFSLAILFCTVILAAERTVAFIKKTKNMHT